VQTPITLHVKFRTSDVTDEEGVAHKNARNSLSKPNFFIPNMRLHYGTLQHHISAFHSLRVSNVYSPIKLLELSRKNFVSYKIRLDFFIWGGSFYFSNISIITKYYDNKPLFIPVCE
jgi:hypothetical protein